MRLASGNTHQLLPKNQPIKLLYKDQMAKVLNCNNTPSTLASHLIAQGDWHEALRAHFLQPLVKQLAKAAETRVHRVSQGQDRVGEVRELGVLLVHKRLELCPRVGGLVVSEGGHHEENQLLPSQLLHVVVRSVADLGEG